MEMMNNFPEILGAIGAFLGGEWLLNIYAAKPKKNSIEMDNMAKAIDNLQEVINTMRESNQNFRKETNSTIDQLNLKIKTLEERIVRKDEAIYSAYECPFPPKPTECVVLRYFRQCHDCDIETRVVNEEKGEQI